MFPGGISSRTSLNRSSPFPSNSSISTRSRSNCETDWSLALSRCDRRAVVNSVVSTRAGFSVIHAPSFGERTRDDSVDSPSAPPDLLILRSWLSPIE